MSKLGHVSVKMEVETYGRLSQSHSGKYGNDSESLDHCDGLFELNEWKSLLLSTTTLAA